MFRTNTPGTPSGLPRRIARRQWTDSESRLDVREFAAPSMES